MTRPSQLEQVPEHLLIHKVLPYLHKGDLALLCSSSKKWKERLSSDIATEAWNAHQATFLFCLDDHCLSCRVSSARGDSLQSAARFMARVPIKVVIIHCIIPDVLTCLESLATRRTVASMSFILTNKTSSPPLDVVLQSCSLSQASFPCLRHLSLNASHLHHVKLPGRARLLDILGRNLDRLEFQNLSPSGAFAVVASRCPTLTALRIDKAQVGKDIDDFASSTLIELDLCRCMFIPAKRLSLPKLEKLVFTPSFRMDKHQVESCVRFIPISLQKLRLEVPSTLASYAISRVARQLPNLLSLSIEGAYDIASLPLSCIQDLIRLSKNLQCFEVHHSKCITRLGFDSIDTLLILLQHPSLQVVKVMVDDMVLTALERILQVESPALRALHLKSKHQWIDPASWQALDEKCKHLTSHVHASRFQVVLEQF